MEEKSKEAPGDGVPDIPQTSARDSMFTIPQVMSAISGSLDCFKKAQDVKGNFKDDERNIIQLYFDYMCGLVPTLLNLGFPGGHSALEQLHQSISSPLILRHQPAIEAATSPNVANQLNEASNEQESISIDNQMQFDEMNQSSQPETQASGSPNMDIDIDALMIDGGESTKVVELTGHSKNDDATKTASNDGDKSEDRISIPTIAKDMNKASNDSADVNEDDISMNDSVAADEAIDVPNESNQPDNTGHSANEEEDETGDADAQNGEDIHSSHEIEADANAHSVFDLESEDDIDNNFASNASGLVEGDTNEEGDFREDSHDERSLPSNSNYAEEASRRNESPNFYPFDDDSSTYGVSEFDKSVKAALRTALTDDAEDDNEMIEEESMDHHSSGKEVGYKAQLSRTRLFSSSSEENNESCDRTSSRCETTDSSNDSLQRKNKKKNLKRKRKIVYSDDDDGDDKETHTDSDVQEIPATPRRKKLRPLISQKCLSQTTKDAEKAERERRKRVEEKEKLFSQLAEKYATQSSQVNEVILDMDKVTEEVTVQVNDNLAKHLKPHQAEGIRFLFDCTIESVEQLGSDDIGSGCILAHSMGLGKTLQVIAFLHTIMTNPLTKEKFSHILIIVPTNVIENWDSEFSTWFNLCGLQGDLRITKFSSATKIARRVDILDDWYLTGGILLITKDLFVSLTVGKSKNKKPHEEEAFHRYLFNPGPDMVIIDEGHLLKNVKSEFNRAVSQISTRRRVILTGTPLQNNLAEYFTMVDFVKPRLLGSLDEFKNRFENPIKKGQHIDSEPYEVQLMKKRIHVLHKFLDKSIHRRDYFTLRPYLKSKFEYVLGLRLTETQIQLYKGYLDLVRGDPKLLRDSNIFSYICNHPALLRLCKPKSKPEKEETSHSMDDFIVDEDFENTTAEPSGGDPDVERSAEPWYEPLMPATDEELYSIELSVKFILLFTILDECEIIRDKILVFSQRLGTLNLIERLLRKKDQNHWRPGKDYYRIDGQVKSEDRASIIERFNDPKNKRTRLMLVSTKAGGVGINLVGANRCIIFDASWNPSNDLQAIYRIYRYGQSKPVYIYRFTSYGTLENKVYDRQVTKESLSRRLVDAKQIQRHFTANELNELYQFNHHVDENRPRLNVPSDMLLAQIFIEKPDLIVTCHEHDSLLENRPDENLTEEELQLAWDEYERERGRVNLPTSPEPNGHIVLPGAASTSASVDIQPHSPIVSTSPIRLSLPIGPSVDVSQSPLNIIIAQKIAQNQQILNRNQNSSPPPSPHPSAQCAAPSSNNLPKPQQGPSDPPEKEPEPSSKSAPRQSSNNKNLDNSTRSSISNPTLSQKINLGDNNIIGVDISVLTILAFEDQKLSYLEKKIEELVPAQMLNTETRIEAMKQYLDHCLNIGQIILDRNLANLKQKFSDSEFSRLPECMMALRQIHQDFTKKYFGSKGATFYRKIKTSFSQKTNGGGGPSSSTSAEVITLSD